VQQSEEVNCIGGDGNNHLVRVPWPEYHEIEGGRTMQVYAGSDPSATFRRHMEESGQKGPCRTVYAYV
jgi:hypothetical protein